MFDLSSRHDRPLVALPMRDVARGGAMNIQFLATVAMIAPAPIDSRKLYVEALGLPLQGEGDGYQHSEEIAGCRSFGIWPLAQAARACFGIDQWPQGRAVPQVSMVASQGVV
jgi:hypothetical protein